MTNISIQTNIASRQVHLDFHTSEWIPGVGEKFNKEQWQEALRLGHVDSITLFAKCHHSWSYYPTNVGRIHPNLKSNLLQQQIDACHEIGVKAPIYMTVGWSANDAEQHPEWCVRKEDGSFWVTDWDFEASPSDPRSTGSWKFLCPSGDYLQHLLDQTREICEMFRVDGMFYDITYGPNCYCEKCLAGMKSLGLDSTNSEDVTGYNWQKWMEFKKRCNEIIHAYHPDATVFYNGMAFPYHSIETRGDMTHLELEDMPTVWGGYEKLPFFARYFANGNLPCVAMSGKFHTMWGEFGGYKHRDALRFEAATMLSYGVGCSFGDQLAPSGKMDLDTYRNIGYAYEYVEKIQSFRLGGIPAARLGVWLSGTMESTRTGLDPHDLGVIKMLLEGQEDFRIVTDDASPDEFDTIVLTGNVFLDSQSAERLRRFVDNGGGVLLLGRSGLDEAGKKFCIDVGAEYLGEANYENDYTKVGETLSKDMVASPFLNYTAGCRVKPTDAAVLATLREPYFDRTYEQYCSHQNTPSQEVDAEHPAAIRKGNVIYIAHPLGKIYNEHGAHLHRQYFHNALGLIHTQPVLRTTMPSSGKATILHQPDHNRYVVHLLYATPLKRGKCLVIEDIVPLYNIPVQIAVPQTIVKATLATTGEMLKIQCDREYTYTTVPKIKLHEAVVFEYE